MGKSPRDTHGRLRAPGQTAAIRSMTGDGKYTHLKRERRINIMMSVNGQQALQSGSWDERIAEIAVLAYQIYLENGCPDGQDREHWAEAERRLAESGRS